MFLVKINFSEEVSEEAEDILSENGFAYFIDDISPEEESYISLMNIYTELSEVAEHMKNLYIELIATNSDDCLDFLKAVEYMDLRKLSWDNLSI